MIKPLNNHCLIEVTNEYDGLVGGSTDDVQSGVLRDAYLIDHHLTASAGYLIRGIDIIAKDIENWLDKTVYWQEYADMGSKFTIEGKNYVLVPFYRLIGFEEN